MDAWEEIRQRLGPDRDNSSGQLIFAPGDAAIVTFIGEPYAYEKDGELRVRINVLRPGRKRCDWWEMGVAEFRVLYNVREKYGLDKWEYEILRQAEGSYRILPERVIEDRRTVTPLDLSRGTNA